MDATLIFIICTAISIGVTLLVKMIWDWASNKNGKKEIDILTENLANLKSLIMTSYVTRDDFEKHLMRFEVVRDLSLKYEMNHTILNDTVKQNVQRLSQLENS